MPKWISCVSVFKHVGYYKSIMVMAHWACTSLLIIHNEQPSFFLLCFQSAFFLLSFIGTEKLFCNNEKGKFQKCLLLHKHFGIRFDYEQNTELITSNWIFLMDFWDTTAELFRKFNWISIFFNQHRFFAYISALALILCNKKKLNNSQTI